MKHFLLLIWMTSAICEAAENAGTTELVRPILEASGKSFPEFVSATTVVEIPPLPLPKIGRTSSPIDAVSALVWKQISTANFVVTSANKAEKLKVIESMGKLRGWLLKHDAYANLVFAAYIEESVTMTALSALVEGVITTEEARKLLAALTPDISIKSMLAVVQQTVPQSKALEQFNKMGATNVTLLRIWDMLDQEFHERGVRTIKNLAEQERPASLAFCVALTSSSKRMASFLIEYAAKGGNLNLPNEKLEKEIKRLTPEAIDIIDPASGLKIEPIMFGGVMENVAEWKSRR